MAATFGAGGGVVVVGIGVVMRVVLVWCWFRVVVVVVRLAGIIVVSAQRAYLQGRARAAAGRRVRGREGRARVGEIVRERNGRRGLRQRDFGSGRKAKVPVLEAPLEFEGVGAAGSADRRCSCSRCRKAGVPPVHRRLSRSSSSRWTRTWSGSSMNPRG